MRRPGRFFLLSILALAFSLPGAALAGGVGGFGEIGFHFGEALREGGGGGRWLDAGGGLELTLGPKDSRVHGRVRFGYTAVVDLDEGVQHTGLISGGAMVQLLKDKEKPLGVYALVDFGVSPLVTQLRIFVFADLGVGVRYRLGERLELYGELTGLLRFEKSFSGGPLIFLGARVAID